MYKILDEASIMEYAFSKKEISSFFIPVRATEIGDGNLNFVFMEDAAGRFLILKQAVPYLRCDGAEAVLDKNRILYEYRSLSYFGKSSHYIPKTYLFDAENSVLVMECIDGPVLRQFLTDGGTPNNLALQASKFLARTLSASSAFMLSSSLRSQLAEDFINNTSLMDLTEKYVFTVPYFDNQENFADKDILETRKYVYEDWEFKRQVLVLKERFLNDKQALLHGDFHTGSAMLSSDGNMKVIDSEFANFGPMGFDVGLFLANLIISLGSHTYKRSSFEIIDWHVECIKDFLMLFDQQLTDILLCAKGGALSTQGFIRREDYNSFVKDYVSVVIADTFGYAGLELCRRNLGGAGTADIKMLALQERAQAKKSLISLGRLLVMQRNSLDLDQFINHVKELCTYQKTA